MVSAYTKTGFYIGDPDMAAYLYLKKGLRRLHPVGLALDHSKAAYDRVIRNSSPCSIGYKPETAEWYGWSHRAIYGFKPGDVVERGDCTNSSGYTKEWLAEHPEDDISLPVGWQAQDLDDARRMAAVFAESIS